MCTFFLNHNNFLLRNLKIFKNLVLYKTEEPSSMWNANVRLKNHGNKSESKFNKES